jgi:hypothetical protein
VEFCPVAIPARFLLWNNSLAEKSIEGKVIKRIDKWARTD